MDSSVSGRGRTLCIVLYVTWRQEDRQVNNKQAFHFYKRKDAAVPVIQSYDSLTALLSAWSLICMRKEIEFHSPIAIRYVPWRCQPFTMLKQVCTHTCVVICSLMTLSIKEGAEKQWQWSSVRGWRREKQHVNVDKEKQKNQFSDWLK